MVACGLLHARLFAIAPQANPKRARPTHHDHTTQSHRYSRHHPPRLPEIGPSLAFHVGVSWHNYHERRRSVECIGPDGRPIPPSAANNATHRPYQPIPRPPMDPPWSKGGSKLLGSSQLVPSRPRTTAIAAEVVGHRPAVRSVKTFPC